MDKLIELIGVETELNAVSGALREFAQRLGAPVVGALEVNCSDESQLECAAAFQREFVDRLLPDLKEEARSPFCTRNLGARYEFGSIRVAEHHYALPASRDASKLMVVKINGHVSTVRDGDQVQFGPMQRYDVDSAACGALHAMFTDADLPALDELRQTFRSGGNDRVATLMDKTRVDPRYRHLFASIAGAVLQAERALEDVRAHRPHTPTYYLILPTLIFNQPGPDTELVCGTLVVDYRAGEPVFTRHGLGNDPARYRFALDAGRGRVTEMS